MTNPFDSIISFLAVLVSIGSLIVAIVALRKSLAAEEAKAEYQTVQQQLAELELNQLTKNANIHLEFRHVISTTNIPHKTMPREHSIKIHFLDITNNGKVEAKNVKIIFEPYASNSSLPPGLEAIELIPKLAPGIKVSFPFVMVMISANMLKAVWTWENPDGSEDSKESTMLVN